MASVAEPDLFGDGEGAGASFSCGGALVEESERDVVDDAAVADEVERLENEPEASGESAERVLSSRWATSITSSR